MTPIKPLLLGALLAANGAGALADEDASVLVVDLDPQAHATLALGVWAGRSSRRAADLRYELSFTQGAGI